MLDANYFQFGPSFFVFFSDNVAVIEFQCLPTPV